MADLEKHVSITSADAIDYIIRPLRDIFGVTFFRYLKLYNNGKRVLLSNVPDAIRYIYGQENYRDMWFDGAFEAYTQEGWYTWYQNRLLDEREESDKIQNDLVNIIKVDSGVTFVQEGAGYYEVFSFDSLGADVYKINKKHLVRFIFYFRESAKKWLNIAEREAIRLPIKCLVQLDPVRKAALDFIEATRVSRYYLGGKYAGIYLTSKEAICARWMIEGKSTEEIAIIEDNHPNTIQRHLENIKSKLDSPKQTQVVRELMRSQLVDVVTAG